MTVQTRFEAADRAKRASERQSVRAERRNEMLATICYRRVDSFSNFSRGKGGEEEEEGGRL